MANLSQIFFMSLRGFALNFMTNRLILPLLCVILLSAAALRFYNLNWDDGTFAHPDERSTVAFYAPTITWPKDTATFFDPRQSTLNPFLDINNPTQPRSYTYGHFPLYILVLTAHALNYLAPFTAGILPAAWTTFLMDSLSGHGFAIIGRGLMALSDVVTVYLLFLLGRRIYGDWGGLLAAALSAFTVLQIQLAHFFAVDPVSTTFTLLALYGALLMYERQSVGAALICGVGIGLAVASKFSAIPIAAAPVIASFLAFVQPNNLPPESGGTEGGSTPSLNTLLSLTMLALLTSFLVFAITSPFVLLDYNNFHRAVVEEQGRMVSGEADFPFTRQFRNTTAYVYFLDQQIRWGMGWPLGLVAMAGTLWVIIRAFRRQAHVGELLALSWVILYFGPTGLFLAKFIRYMVPIVPIFTLFGAGLVVSLWGKPERERDEEERERDEEGTKDANNTNVQLDEGTNEPISERTDKQENEIANESIDEEAPLRDPSSSFALSRSPLRDPSPSFALSRSPLRAPSPSFAFSRSPMRLLSLALGSFALIGSVIWSLAFVNGVYGTPHTWVTFANWTYANVPDGSCIAWEHWDDRMPADLPYPSGNPGAHGYRQPQLPMYEEDNIQKYELLRTTLMDCDYIALATNRLYLTIPKLPQRYPMSTRYYEALFSGELGYEQVYSVETPPRLGPLVIDDQSADESFTVYDHPKPIMFKKVRQLSLEEWDKVVALDPAGGYRWDKAIPGYTGGPTLMMRLRGSSDNSPQPDPHAEAEKSGKTLLLDRPIQELPIVNDFRWNSLANNSAAVAVVTWWLALALIGLLTLPLTFGLFYHLPDRGYALSRSLGLLLVSYFVWFNSSWGLFQNRFSTIIMGLILLTIINAWFARRYQAELRHFFSEQHTAIFMVEGVFLAIYGFFIFLRLRNPDLWQPWLGGEKMLEIGFLSAIVKSATMPPYDPFFAGGIINYYYYGLFIVNILIKLTGIEPTIAFNLAVPSLAALTAISVFSLARNLSPQSIKSNQTILSGLLAVIFVIFMGNIEGGMQFLRNLGQVATLKVESTVPGLATIALAADGLRQVWSGASLNTYNFWDPTRVIPETINEFPYFSFLFADLHPHMIGIPFTVLFLSLAYNWFNSEREETKMEREDAKVSEMPEETAERENTEASETSEHEETKISEESPSRPFAFLRPFASSFRALSPHFVFSRSRFFALPFVLGALAVINTWDLPTYLGVMVAAFMLNQYRQTEGELTKGQTLRLFINGAAFGLAILVTTYVMYWPFFAHYQALDVGLGLVHTQTPLDAHLKIWGFFIFIIISWLVISLIHPTTRHSFLRAVSLGLRRWNVAPHLYEIYQRLVTRAMPLYQLGLSSLGLVALFMVMLYGLGYRVPAYLLPLLLLAIILLFRRELSPKMAYLGILFFTGLLVLLGVEIFFLRDFLGGGDYYRMNTLFKFFTQVWVMFGIAAAIIFPQLWNRSSHWHWTWQLLWRIACFALLLTCLVYPPLATQTRLNDRFPGERPKMDTLDGLAYMTVGQFEWPAGNPIKLKYDYQAIHWLQENVTGTPIIAEAKVGYYREGGMRVAAYTGLPSILGGLHQGEQRYASQIGARDMPVNEFWSNPDPNRTLELMQQLNIDYVYIGQVERATHGGQIQQKFDQLIEQSALQLVFENEQTRIYKRKG